MIAKNKVVSIHYTLTDEDGQVLDASEDAPLEYLHGFQNIIPGLEQGLLNLKVGDKKQVKVAPADGYGDYDEGKVFAIPREGVPPKIEAGMSVELQTDAGDPFMCQVVEVQDEHIVLDANHPLAGTPLCFDVEIVSVREGTQEELAHGHVHGPHGH